VATADSQYFSCVTCFRLHRGESNTDEFSEISSTEAHSYNDIRRSFDISLASQPHMTSSSFTNKTISPFKLTAKPNARNLSPKKSPRPSTADVNRTPSGIIGGHNLLADGRVSVDSIFMKSDHISRLNFNSVSTPATSSDMDPAIQWLSTSFSEPRSPGSTTNSAQPTGGFASPVNNVDDEMSPPILKPKVRRMSQRTPDKSPLVTSSSGDLAELGLLPSVGSEQPPGLNSSDGLEFAAQKRRCFSGSDSAMINSTSRRLSISAVDSDAEEQPVDEQFSPSAKNAKQAAGSRRDSYSSAASSDFRNSHKVSKPISKDKASSKTGSRPAKQKAKSPAISNEKQRSELDDAFEAACRLPSTVMGQLPSYNSRKVSPKSFVWFVSIKIHPNTHQYCPEW